MGVRITPRIGTKIGPAYVSLYARPTTTRRTAPQRPTPTTSQRPSMPDHWTAMAQARAAQRAYEQAIATRPRMVVPTAPVQPMVRPVVRPGTVYSTPRPSGFYGCVALGMLLATAFAVLVLRMAVAMPMTTPGVPVPTPTTHGVVTSGPASTHASPNGR